MADLNGIDMKEYGENGLAEIAGLISRREYNIGIVKSRQIAEQLVRSYAAERRIPYTTMADTIEELYQNGAIDRTSRDAYHGIRIYGNKAVQEGDDSADDAQNAMFLLKNELQTYLSRNNVSIDRTPVRVERSQVNRRSGGEERRRPASEGGARRANGERRPAGDRNAKRGGASSQRSGKKGGRPQQEEKGGITIYDILRILIPVIVVILVIIIIRSILPSKTAVPETTVIETTAEVAETVPETTAAPETTAEPETEPEVVRYKIKGDGVNIRYADNQNRIYTQLDSGVEIGEVTPLEDSDFVQFILDGVNVVVRKDFITPIEAQ